MSWIDGLLDGQSDGCWGLSLFLRLIFKLPAPSRNCKLLSVYWCLGKLWRWRLTHSRKQSSRIYTSDKIEIIFGQTSREQQGTSIRRRIVYFGAVTKPYRAHPPCPATCPTGKSQDLYCIIHHESTSRFTSHNLGPVLYSPSLYRLYSSVLEIERRCRSASDMYVFYDRCTLPFWLAQDSLD